jgi:hypothetical protein
MAACACYYVRAARAPDVVRGSGDGAVDSLSKCRSKIACMADGTFRALAALLRAMSALLPCRGPRAAPLRCRAAGAQCRLAPPWCVSARAACAR